MLVTLLGHFQLVDGAHGGEAAQRIQDSFGHNKDRRDSRDSRDSDR